MKKIIISILFILASHIAVFANSSNEKINNISINVNNQTYLWSELYEKIENGLNNKYLDPVNKMNFTNDIIIKLSEIDWKISDDLEIIFQELWNIYSAEVLENKRNTTIVILEGWNIFDIDTYLTQRSLISKWEYINYVENLEKIDALSEFFLFINKQETLEWYLYPDTYKINPVSFQLNNFVILQLNTFEEKVYNKLFIDELTKQQLYSNNIIESVVNLASIVEKEERNISEKPVVAGILKKRLQEYLHLWADITTCYPYRLTSNECKFVISKYIKIETDYNTRTTLWLPPTPINNPSYETINATLNDKESEYYYYLHDTSTGKIYYWKDYSEHQINIKNHLK